MEAMSSTETSSRLKLWMSCCTTFGMVGRLAGTANRASSDTTRLQKSALRGNTPIIRLSGCSQRPEMAGNCPVIAAPRDFPFKCNRVLPMCVE